MIASLHGLRPPSFTFAAPLLAVTGLCLSSCKRLDERMEITGKREISSYSTAPKPLASSPERFYDSQPTEPAVPQGNPLTWVTPPGWQEVAPGSAAGSMRLIDMRIGEKGEGECYLSAIPGNAGGLDANVNRWRGQMGQTPLTPDELGRLPKKTFLGRDAVFVEIEGDFKGMGATEAQKGYRMVGLVQQAPEFTLFVKMTGPKELILQQQGAFDQFCQSISIKR
jgi:hypothetical protein